MIAKALPVVLLLAFSFSLAVGLDQTVCDDAAKKADHYGKCGCPYVYGGDSCGCEGKDGMDCSGLVYRSYREAGWDGIERTTYEQVKQGEACDSKCSPRDTSKCNKGDLFFYCFYSPCPDHVVMYIGDGKVAECPHTGENCHVIEPYDTHYYTCRKMCKSSAMNETALDY